MKIACCYCCCKTHADINKQLIIKQFYDKTLWKLIFLAAFGDFVPNSQFRAKFQPKLTEVSSSHERQHVVQRQIFFSKLFYRVLINIQVG